MLKLRTSPPRCRQLLNQSSLCQSLARPSRCSARGPPPGPADSASHDAGPGRHAAWRWRRQRRGRLERPAVRLEGVRGQRGGAGGRRGWRWWLCPLAGWRRWRLHLGRCAALPVEHALERCGQRGRHAGQDGQLSGCGGAGPLQRGAVGARGAAGWVAAHVRHGALRRGGAAALPSLCRRAASAHRLPCEVRALLHAGLRVHRGGRRGAQGLAGADEAHDLGGQANIHSRVRTGA